MSANPRLYRLRGDPVNAAAAGETRERLDSIMLQWGRDPKTAETFRSRFRQMLRDISISLGN